MMPSLLRITHARIFRTYRVGTTTVFVTRRVPFDLEFKVHVQSFTFQVLGQGEA
ncbi:hypothetical protein [Nitrospira sp. BLG_1]|uniref:hypothetical protein n=1 Tax=Nitrospira sp. BLG_1 TaxID=3395883 RepID=UPI0039BC29B3